MTAVEADSRKRPALGGICASSKRVIKVVAIYVRSSAAHYQSAHRDRPECERLTTDLVDEDRAIDLQVVDTAGGRIALWVLRSPSGDLRLADYFLRGATTAIIILALSDWKTIRSSLEFARSICRNFSIPVILVVTGESGYDVVNRESIIELVKTASKVVDCS
jgi:hypothetical protein